MVSELAISELERLAADGLHPTFEDVIRLNALGLKLEGTRAKRQVDSTFYLPRVAQITDAIAFRQPTIGHEVWFDKLRRFVDYNDFDTALAIKAFALSRPSEDLPDADDPKSVKVAVETFANECRDLTRQQIFAALVYVINGCNPADGETAAKPKRKPNGFAQEDWDECVALGVMNEGRAVLWGITEADMKRMTARQLSDLISRAYELHDMKVNGEASAAEGAFFATLDEIEGRLKSGRG